MNNKMISGAICSLLIVLLVFPMISMPLSSFGALDSMTRQNTKAMQGPPVEMRINVLEDESVASNHTDGNFDGNTAQGGVVSTSGMFFHVGPNADQRIGVSIANMGADALKLMEVGAGGERKMLVSLSTPEMANT